MKIRDLYEDATPGASASGNVASVNAPLGGPMAAVIRRMPPGQSFFGMSEPGEISDDGKKLKKKRPVKR